MPTQTISSNTTILTQVASQTIQADSIILTQQGLQTITGGAMVMAKVKEILSSLKLVKLSESDKDAEVITTQTVPAIPTLLTATDMLLGDVIRLVWSGTAPFYNVYYKVTAFGPYIKANGVPLPSAPLQYDVGGLVNGTNYTFKVRGVNGVGIESADSNTLTATPTIDIVASRFTKPTWEIKVNAITNPDAKLARVELGFGDEISNATFTVYKDPDGGGFPVYNDDIEIIINGRSVLIGKIKGITSQISESGLTKVFTVLSNITQYQEKVVPIAKTIWNFELTEGQAETKSQEILRSVLGYLPVDSPNQEPGQLFFTDMTPLQAVESLLSRLGNYKLYFNKTTGLLEIYKFGQGGVNVRQFIKGKNIIDVNITENRQDIVDKLTIVGPPRAIRKRRELGKAGDLELASTLSGIIQRMFRIQESGVRDIQVFGIHRDKPTVVPNQIRVLPEDMGFIGVGDQRPSWPNKISTSDIVGSDGKAIGFRNGVAYVQDSATIEAPVGVSVEYVTRDDAKVFLADIPKVWFYHLISAFVDRKKIGVVPADGLPISVQVERDQFWISGNMRVSYTVDGDRPTVSTGSGTIERTITDTQYQISINQIPTEIFTNETEITAIMQKRLTAEFSKLNRPKISGSITVMGDETIDLKSTVLYNGTYLDVTRVVHDFGNGFRTNVTLTNEPFVAATFGDVPRQRSAVTTPRIIATAIKLDFEKVSIDKNIAAQRQQEFNKTVNPNDPTYAAYLD